MNEPTVYVVQDVVRREPGTGTYMPAFDLTPAATYGRIETMLPPGQMSLMPGRMIETLRHKLRDFGPNDYLLPVGDPLAIMAAARIASDVNCGVVKVLRWDNRARTYIVVTLDFTTTR